MGIGAIKTYPVLNIQRISPKDEQKNPNQQQEQREDKKQEEPEQPQGNSGDGHIDEFA